MLQEEQKQLLIAPFLELKQIKYSTAKGVVTLLIAPFLELKHEANTFEVSLHLAFNRTIFGIETDFQCLSHLFQNAFNRTIFGIETRTGIRKSKTECKLLIAPFLELKLKSAFALQAYLKNF